MLVIWIFIIATNGGYKGWMYQCVHSFDFQQHSRESCTWYKSWLLYTHKVRAGSLETELLPILLIRSTTQRWWRVTESCWNVWSVWSINVSVLFAEYLAEEMHKLLVNKLGAICNTVYGQFWTFQSDLTKINVFFPLCDALLGIFHIARAWQNLP